MIVCVRRVIIFGVDVKVAHRHRQVTYDGYVVNYFVICGLEYSSGMEL